MNRPSLIVNVGEPVFFQAPAHLVALITAVIARALFECPCRLCRARKSVVS